MIQAIQAIKPSLKRLPPEFISFFPACYAVFIYPHTFMGGAWLQAVTMIEILLFSSFFLFAVARLYLRQRMLERSPVFPGVLALLALSISTACLAKNRAIALEAIWLFLAYLVCFYLFQAMCRTRNSGFIISCITAAVALVLSVHGFYYFDSVNQWSDGVWRLRATFGNSNQMGGCLSLSIPVTAGLILTGRLEGWKLYLVWTGLVIMVAALFFTFARGGWISTAVALSFILFMNRIFPGRRRSKGSPRVLFRVLGSCLVLFLVFLSSTNLVNRFNTLTRNTTEENIYGRLLAWEGTLDMIRANPWHGVGPGNYPGEFPRYQPPGLADQYVYAHCDYLQFISENGILLIPVMIWLMYKLFVHGIYKLKRGDSRTRGTTLGAMGSILAILVYSLTDFNLHIPANALLFTVLCALVAAPLPDTRQAVT